MRDGSVRPRPQVADLDRLVAASPGGPNRRPCHRGSSGRLGRRDLGRRGPPDPGAVRQGDPDPDRGASREAHPSGPGSGIRPGRGGAGSADTAVGRRSETRTPDLRSRWHRSGTGRRGPPASSPVEGNPSLRPEVVAPPGERSPRDRWRTGPVASGAASPAGRGRAPARDRSARTEAR